MRVLQLIDSLETGGAERVAVNLANALSSKIDKSFLCSTRKEGLLKAALSKDVEYLFLNKKGVIDFIAIKKLNNFVKQHHIQIIHAHSTSFFLATIIKLLNSELTIIWHDHYGNSENLEIRKFKVLCFCSQYFIHIFSVNKILETWAAKNLKSKSISYLPNFAIQDTLKPITQLRGENGKRILHLANLRPQKDHQTLINAFSNVLKNHSDWTLHCVGKDFNDAYSESIQGLIKHLNLGNSVFFYGSKLDITNIIKQCEIGVLSSKSEGLPVALLEYGLAGLPVIVTDVGDCTQVVVDSQCGLLIQKENEEALAAAIVSYITNEEKRKLAGQNLKHNVEIHFSESAVIDNLLKVYKQFLR